MKGYHKQGSNGGPHGLCALQLEEGSHTHGQMLLFFPNWPPEHLSMAQRPEQVHSGDGRMKQRVVGH